MIEAILIFMLALNIGDMGIAFWVLLFIFIIIKLIRIMVWFLEEIEG